MLIDHFLAVKIKEKMQMAGTRCGEDNACQYADYAIPGGFAGGFSPLPHSKRRICVHALKTRFAVSPLPSPAAIGVHLSAIALATADRRHDVS